MSLPPALSPPAEPPLDPSPEQARSLLRGELVRGEYHEQDLLQRLVTWVERQVGRGLEAASQAPPLSTFLAMLVGLLLVLALVWLGSRARRSGPVARVPGPVLPTEPVSAHRWRALAEEALAQGRYEEALVDGFRALVVRQVERGRLDDQPGATAHEVAEALGTAYPSQRPRLEEAARLFDLVRYGDRPAGPDQAAAVLTLDAELEGLR